MTNMMIAIEVFVIGMIFVAIRLLQSGDDSREPKMMGYFLCGALVQNVGYLMELTAPSLDAALLAVKFQYLGSIFVPFCYARFTFSYCYQKVPHKLFRVLAVLDLAILALILISDYHDLYYRNVEWLTTDNGHSYIAIDYGPIYPIFLLFGCAIPFTISGYAMVRAAMQSSERSEKRKYKTMIFLSGIPMAALLIYASKLLGVYDLSPAALGLVLALVVILVWSRRNYDFRRLAAEVVLNSMGDGVIALDYQKRIVSYNQAAADIFGDLGAGVVDERVVQLSEFDEGKLGVSAKKEFCIKDRYYESHTECIPDKSGKNQGYVILVLDVTDTRNYIEEIKSVREQAEQANEAKSEFLANMSHEIRTPMNAIVGLSNIILEESRETKEYSHARDIKQASENLLAIINDILDLSKVEAGKMELKMSDYYIQNIVNDVVGMMDMAASQKGLLLKCEYDMTIPCGYYGDDGRIKQILINLLNNAVKFTKEGHVEVYVGGEPADTEDQEVLVFRVQDTGCGIKEEDQEKIFDDFSQVDARKNRSIEGTGLGLSITKRLVEMMNGSIDLQSVYGEGTTFTVRIPQRIVDRECLAMASHVLHEKKEPAQTFQVKDYHVLIVDDNQVNRKVAKGFLKAYGFQMTEAASGKEAIELVEKQCFDMIFMDHMMPEMDGVEAVQIIRRDCGENGSRPVIVALTANAMEGVREKFLQNGFQDFIAKPLERETLNQVLAKWIPDELRIHKEKGQQDDTADSEFGSICIKGLDPEAVGKYQTGDYEDFVELLQIYCMDGKRKTNLLRELLDQKDYKNYEIEVHGLKSASANIGAMEVSRIAKEHEMAVGSGEYSFVENGFSELLSVYIKQLSAIQEYLDNKVEQNIESDLPALEQEELIKKVREALSQLEMFHNHECAAIIDELLQYSMKQEFKVKLKEIREQLKMYEDDNAESLLGQFLRELGGEE